MTEAKDDGSGCIHLFFVACVLISITPAICWAVKEWQRQVARIDALEKQVKQLEGSP